MSFKELTKAHKAHLSKGKKLQKPSEDAYRKQDNELKKKIADFKLQLAELKYEKDVLLRQTEKVKLAQSETRKHLDAAQKKLTERKRETKKRTQELSKNLGIDTARSLPKRIVDPQGTLAKYKAEYDRENMRLKTEEISKKEERDCVNNMKILKKNIAAVQEYIDKNVGTIYEAEEDSKKDLAELRAVHQQAFETFSTAKENANSEFDKLDVNSSSQEDITKKIKDLQSDRTDIQTKFRNKLEEWKTWQRTKSIMENVLRDKDNYEEEVEASKPKAKKPEGKSEAAKKKAEEEEEKRKEAQEKVQSVEERRKAAVEAWKKCQDKLNNATSDPPAGEVAVQSGVVEAEPAKEDDPHHAEKEVCKSLIAYCQSNMPSENSPSKGGKKKKRKKKKGFRLSHKPIIFSNFAKVGVGIPIWSSDLEKCVKHLEERITSYDKPDVETEEDEKVSSI